MPLDPPCPDPTTWKITSISLKRDRLTFIGRLQAAEFLYEAGLFPDLEYTFKHVLTLEVTCGSLL